MDLSYLVCLNSCYYFLMLRFLRFQILFSEDANVSQMFA